MEIQSGIFSLLFIKLTGIHFTWITNLNCSGRKSHPSFQQGLFQLLPKTTRNSLNLYQLLSIRFPRCLLSQLNQRRKLMSFPNTSRTRNLWPKTWIRVETIIQLGCTHKLLKRLPKRRMYSRSRKLFQLSMQIKSIKWTTSLKATQNLNREFKWWPKVSQENRWLFQWAKKTIMLS